MYLGNNENNWRVGLNSIETKKTKCYAVSNAISFLLSVYAVWTLETKPKPPHPTNLAKLHVWYHWGPSTSARVILLVCGFGTKHIFYFLFVWVFLVLKAKCQSNTFLIQAFSALHKIQKNKQTQAKLYLTPSFYICAILILLLKNSELRLIHTHCSLCSPALIKIPWCPQSTKKLLTALSHYCNLSKTVCTFSNCRTNNHNP